MQQVPAQLGREAGAEHSRSVARCDARGELHQAQGVRRRPAVRPQHAVEGQHLRGWSVVDDAARHAGRGREEPTHHVSVRSDGQRRSLPAGREVAHHAAIDDGLTGRCGQLEVARTGVIPGNVRDACAVEGEGDGGRILLVTINT